MNGIANNRTQVALEFRHLLLPHNYCHHHQPNPSHLYAQDPLYSISWESTASLGYPFTNLGVCLQVTNMIPVTNPQPEESHLSPTGLGNLN